LDFYTIDKINSATKDYYPKSKKYYGLTFIEKTTIYDGLKFSVLNKDKKFIIQSIQGRLQFEDIKKCLKKKKSIVNEISSSFNVIKTTNHEVKYPQYINSRSIITELDIDGGRIRVYCDDLSTEMREQGYMPSLAVDISPHLFLVWLNLKAY
jgi:hypothetical protein